MEPEVVPPELDEPQENLLPIDCDSGENYGKNLYDSSDSNAIDLLSRLLQKRISKQENVKEEKPQWQWK